MQSLRRLLALALALSGCESAVGPQFERIARVEVAATYVECNFVPGGPQCLSVRWDNDGTWETLSGFQGFAFEPGHTYLLDVARFGFRGPRNPDQQPVHRLVRIVRKTRVPPA